MGFDLQDVTRVPLGGAFVRVRDTTDLFDRLRDLRPDVAVIESPCSEHPAHIELTLDAGVHCVITDKMLAEETEAAVTVAESLRQRPGGASVGVYDHYLHLNSLLLLRAAHWVGEVRSIRAEFYETGGVGPDQVRSHRRGMMNFLHHAAALPTTFGVRDLRPVAAVFARHPEAAVTDTYRAFRAEACNGRSVLTAAVGKCMPRDKKTIHIVGSRGSAMIDRRHNRMLVKTRDGRVFVIRQVASDSGYGPLALAIVNHRMPPNILTPDEAVSVMQLMDDAHRRATELSAYPTSESGTLAHTLIGC